MTETDIVEPTEDLGESSIQRMRLQDDCDRSGAPAMKYTFDPETYLISNETGDVRVKCRSTDREGSWSFVLYMNGKAFGFETGVRGSKFYPSRTDDGVVVWRIQNICIPLSTVHFRDGTEELHTDTTKFIDELEQEDALRVFGEALSVYDDNPITSAKGNANARVEYSEAVLQKVRNGEYLA